MYYAVFLRSNNSFLGTYTNIRLGSFYKLLEFFRGINTNIKRSFLPDYSDYHVVQGHIWKTKMGKHKVTNEGNLYSMVLPSPNDVLGIAVKMLGAERIMVQCQDKRRGHSLSLTMGLPIRIKGRHILALQKKPVRLA